jgi:hypothetical protein
MKRHLSFALVMSLFLLGMTANLISAQQSQTGLNYQPIMSGTTGSIGGSLLVVGASASGTVTITGAQPGMPCDASPSDGTDFAGLGALVSCTVTSSGTATVRVMAVISLTPSSKTFNVRVIP